MLTFEQYKAQYIDDVGAWVHAQSFEALCEHVAQLLEGKRVWTGSVFMPHPNSKEFRKVLYDHYVESSQGSAGGALNKDTLAVAPLLVQINREGHALTWNSQGGQVIEGAHYKTKKPFREYQHAYLEIYVEKRRVNAIAGTLRKYKLIVQTEPLPHEEAFPVTYYTDLDGSNYEDFTWARGPEPLAQMPAFRPFPWMPERYAGLVIVDPKVGTNRMWPTLLKVLRKNP